MDIKKSKYNELFHKSKKVDPICINSIQAIIPATANQSDVDYLFNQKKNKISETY